MKYFLYTLLLFPVLAVAGYSSSILLDIDGCSIYYITDEPAVPYDQDPAKYKEKKDKHEKAINDFKRSHDETWQEWTVRTGRGVNYYAVCKQIYDPELRKYTRLQCHGDSDFPLKNLSCTYGSGNKWYSKCTATARPSADIRLYWEDVREYEEGENPNKNIGYEHDLKRFEMKCSQKR